MRKEDFKLDFDDNKTSFLERCLLWTSIVLILISTIAEVLQVIIALGVL